MIRLSARRSMSIGARIVVAAALVTTTVVTSGAAASAAGQAQPAAAVSPRAANVVAGIHDTAINDCDQSGALALPTPTTPLNSTQIAQAGESVNSPLFPAGVTTVRVTMPWDVADPGVVNGSVAANPTLDIQTLYGTKACLDAWLQAVFARGRQPEIDFRADVNFADASTQVRMPSLAQYQAAMLAFRSQYLDCPTTCADGGQVKVIAPWNEPDNMGQSKVGSTYDLLFPDGQTHLAGTTCPASPTAANCGAVMAAQMWVTDYQLFEQGTDGGTACSGCTIPAGDFSAGQGFLTIQASGACPNSCPYLYLYNNSLSGLRPGHWAVHPYTDTEAYQSGTPASPTRLADFAAKLQKYGYGTSTFIWLNEISVCSAAGPGTCAKTIVNDQNAAMGYLVGSAATDLMPSVAAGGPQVGRIDYYCFNGAEAACNNQWGLVVNGALTPAGQTYATWASS